MIKIDNEFYDVPCPFTREYLLKKQRKAVQSHFYELLLEIIPLRQESVLGKWGDEG